MSDGSDSAISSTLVKRLGWLVTLLTVVMILGMVAVVGLMVMRLNAGTALPLPETLSLPEGQTASAVTITKDRILVVTDDKALLVFDRTKGTLLQTVPLP